MAKVMDSNDTIHVPNCSVYSETFFTIPSNEVIRFIMNEAIGSKNSNHQQLAMIVACINTGIFPCDIITFSRQQVPQLIELHTLNPNHTVFTDDTSKLSLYLRSKQPQQEDKMRDACTLQ
jgi:hypothetical protein